MFGLFNKQEPEMEAHEIFFNPDPIVNRLDAIIRYSREYEVAQDIETRKIIMKCIETLFMSFEMEHYKNEVTH
jgi:hypothetical protein